MSAAAPAPVVETPASTPPAHVAAPAAPAAPASWRSELPADIRDNPLVVGYGDDPKVAIPKLVKEHVNLQKLIGAKGVIPPGKDATEEDKARFYNQLGRPETPDKYDLTSFKPPEGVPWDDGFLQAIIPKLHARGASQEFVQGLLGDYGDLIKGQWDGMQGQLEERAKAADQALRQEWGSAHGAKMELAARALKLAAGDSYEQIRNMKTMDGVAFGDHPDVLRVLATFGDKLSKEHAFVGEKQTRITMTPEEAGLERRKLEAKGSPYWDADHAEHKQAVLRVSELIAMEKAK